MINKVKEKLVPFMREFDAENRGNRLSKELVSGFGGFLENLILELLNDFQQEIKQEKVDR